MKHAALPTVTVGIPAYNATRNIRAVLRMILAQKTPGFTLNQILVYSDGSTDDTISVAREIIDSRITLVDEKQNRGFAYGVQYLLTHATGDTIVLLNDDIRLADTQALARLVSACAEKTVGFVCGRIVPLPPQTFIERAVFSSFTAYSVVKELDKGENLYTCDGKVMALSAPFARTVDLFKDPVGNVDLYLYLHCRHLGFSYRYISEPTVLFRLPQTAQDLWNQTYRSNITRTIGSKQYTTLYEEEIHRAAPTLRRAILKEALRNPLGALAVFIINHWGKVLFGIPSTSATTWTLAASTKQL